jgi:protein-tyrosine-phosphatase
MDPISPELVLVDPQLASSARKPGTRGPFRVAFVCTGNRFRSALAEAAFRAVTAGLPLEVSSFGVLDVGSLGPLPQALEAAETFGLEISAHIARPLAGADLAEMSLVVGFEMHHADAAVELAGARPERAFLLLELVDLLDGVPPVVGPDPIERAAGAVARAHRRRAAEPELFVRRVIPDPAELGETDQAVIGRVVCEATIRLAKRLFEPSR